MGVVIRRYIDILIIIITFPYSTCISSFLAAASLFLCSFFKCFFVFVIISVTLLIVLVMCDNNYSRCMVVFIFEL